MVFFFRKKHKIHPIVFEQPEFSYLYKNCPICLCEMKSKSCTTLSCGHAFHTDCILKSFSLSSMNCPICKKRYIWSRK